MKTNCDIFLACQYLFPLSSQILASICPDRSFDLNSGLWLVTNPTLSWWFNTSFIRAQQHLLRKLFYWKYFQTFLAQPNLYFCFLAGGLNNALVLFWEFQNFDREIYYSFHLLLPADNNCISEMKDEMKKLCIGNNVCL